MSTKGCQTNLTSLLNLSFEKDLKYYDSSIARDIHERHRFHILLNFFFYFIFLVDDMQRKDEPFPNQQGVTDSI